jgi:hypothetical protein
MLEVHKRIAAFLNENYNNFPQDITIAVISYDRAEGTVSATTRGKLDPVNTKIGLDILLKIL